MKNITPEELAELDGATILDVREVDEVATVRVPGSVNVPMSGLPEHLDELPDGTLYVMCHLGGRSAKVTQYLEERGYDVVNVSGGITDWQEKGLPVDKG